MKHRISFLIVLGLWLLTLALLAVAVLLLHTIEDPPWSPVEPPVILIMALTFSMGGGLIAWRRPDVLAGWLLFTIGLVWMAVTTLSAYLAHLRAAGTASLTAERNAAWFLNWIWGLAYLASFVFFLFYPNNRLPSPRWRAVVWALAIGGVLGLAHGTLLPGPLAEKPTFVNPYGVTGAGGVLNAAGTVSDQLTNFVGVAALVSLVVRFRRADLLQRQQLLWMAVAGVLFAILTTIGHFVAGYSDGAYAAVLFHASFMVVPVAAAIAILRYRLYSIDRVVSTAVTYAVLAAIVAAVFVVVGAALGAFVSRDIASLPLSIVATATVAICYQPVRKRLQRFAHRIVYGRRAAPYELLAGLSRRMGEPVTTEVLLPEMAKALAEGTGASWAGVWLASGNEMRLAADYPAEDQRSADRVPADCSMAPHHPASHTVPVVHEGELLGALVVTKPADEVLTPVEDKLMSDLATQAGLAMRNVRLIEELKASRQRIVTAQDGERRRLERDIHDGAQQGLITLSLALRVARVRAGIGPGLAATLDSAASELNSALIDLRGLARGIHPAILSDQGLGPALTTLSEHSAIATTLISAPATRLPAPVEATAYHVAAHALSTAAQAGASAASIRVRYAAGNLVVEVTDDATHAIKPARPPNLDGLDDRVAALDGRIETESLVGRGNVIRAVIPCGLC